MPNNIDFEGKPALGLGGAATALAPSAFPGKRRVTGVGESEGLAIDRHIAEYFEWDVVFEAPDIELLDFGARITIEHVAEHVPSERESVPVVNEPSLAGPQSPFSHVVAASGGQLRARPSRLEAGFDLEIMAASMWIVLPRVAKAGRWSEGGG